MSQIFNVPWLTESIKKCSIKYLIQRYLGRYLSHELDLSQFNFSLFNGRGSIHDIPLDVSNINEEVGSHVPIQFLEGYVSRIELQVPWSSLWTESCTIHLEGIQIRFCKQDKFFWYGGLGASASLLSKSIVASSKEIAEEIIQQESEKFDGLEKFAALINSVIRRFKISARNTVIKFMLPKKLSGDGQEIELRIGYMLCEEEGLTFDETREDGSQRSESTDKSNSNSLPFSDVITKRVTVEGIEVLINDVMITKLYGKHSFTVRFDNNRIDLDAFFGSYIYAILNTNQLMVLQEFVMLFAQQNNPTIGRDTKTSLGQHLNKTEERPMTKDDYRKLEELFQKNRMKKFDEMNTSILSGGGGSGGGGGGGGGYNNPHWTTTDNMDDNEVCFKPFNTSQSKENATGSDSSEDTSCKFMCNLKIPDVIMCLITENVNMPKFTEMPMVDNLQTFIGINELLNDLLSDFNHIRILASNLCFKVLPDEVLFTCINVSVYEYADEKLNNILTVSEKELTEGDVSPSVRLKVMNQDVKIDLCSSWLRLDVTMIERHQGLLNLFPKSSDTSSKSLSKIHSSSVIDNQPVVTITCPKVDIELLFPIPDLRENRTEYSLLHKETLVIELYEAELSIKSTGGTMVCGGVDIALKLDKNDQPQRVFHYQSQQNESLFSLDFSTLNPLHMQDELNEDYLLKQTDSMVESVNYLNASMMTRGNNCKSPFQVKRKIFADEDSEQILTPGDQDHTRRYLTSNKCNAKCLISIQVPNGELYLMNKTIFELIYNRFVNDLVLWTPYSPPINSSKCSVVVKPSAMVTSDGYPDSARVHSIVQSDIFASVMSGNDMMSESERSGFSTDSNVESYDISSSQTLCDDRLSPSSTHQSSQLPMPANTNQLNFHPMNASIDSNASDLYHSVLNQSTLNSTSTSVGKLSNEFMIELEIDNLQVDFISKSQEHHKLFTQNILLGVVVGPESERKTIICLCCEDIIYHYKDQPVLVVNKLMEAENSSFNMSLDIKRERDDLKKIKIALQLKQALMQGIDLSVFEELFDFASLKDDDILGYVCPKVIVELHTDIVQCGITLEHLKERTVLLQCEDIYLTSMVVENTYQTVLRFFIEEALLCFKRNTLAPDTLKNFVSVIDSGIIDLNLKVSKDGKVELKISNNELHIKACPDSFSALCHFLQAFSTSLANDMGNGNFESVIQEDIVIRHSNNNGAELLAEALIECTNNDNQNNINGNDGGGGGGGKTTCYCDAQPKIDESAFWMLGDDDLGAGISLSKDPVIRTLSDEPIKILENHFKVTNYSIIPEISSATLAYYLLDKMSLRVSLYDGKDFDDPVDSNVQQHQQQQQYNSKQHMKSDTYSFKSGKSSATAYSVGNQKVRFSPSTNSCVWENIDLLSNNNGYITAQGGSHTGRIQRNAHISLKNSGGIRRKTDTCVVFEMNRIKLLFENFQPDCPLSWRMIFLVNEIQILDNVKASKIKKILYEYTSESIPRRKYMFLIRLNSFRNFQDQNEECDLQVSLKPLRVNIDQDTLIFVMNFFTTTNEIMTAKMAEYCAANANATSPNVGNLRSRSSSNSSMGGCSDTGSECSFQSRGSIRRTVVNNGSRTSLNTELDEQQQQQPEDTFQPPLSTYSDMSLTGPNNGVGRRSSTSSNGPLDTIFIKSFTFAPDVPIRLDYHGKHIDFKQGAFQGLFLGLGQLNQSEITLKKLCNRNGMLGFEKVLLYIAEEWAKDIKRNQLPSILGGVGPMSHVLQLFQGIRDLFYMPFEQWRRDQRIVRGLQRGATSFSISTTIAMIELTNRVVSMVQCLAQFTHDVVVPPVPANRGGQVAIYHHSQPRDFREGITVAYSVIREGMHETVRNVTNANLVADDVRARIGEIVRQIPPTIVLPIIHLTQATSNVLVGVRNQLTPEARKDDHEKWKNANER